MTPDEILKGACFPDAETRAAVVARVEAAYQAGYEAARADFIAIANDYDDWTYWGMYSNANAASAAADEIAKAIELRRALTPDEISDLDKRPLPAPPKEQG